MEEGEIGSESRRGEIYYPVPPPPYGRELP